MNISGVWRAHWAASASSRPQVSFAPSDSRSAGADRPARILLVEDDYFVATELEHRLSEAGFAVVGVAATAEEAIEQAAAQKPELAVMDVRLAGLRDGVDAAIELLARFGIPSIFASAHTDPHTQQRAQRAAPAGWLQKPYSAEALIALINTALATRR